MLGIVEWDKTNRDAITKPFFWTEIPDTEQVRLSQEDLWVYEALLRIIKDVNKGATGYDDAPIRRIDALEIGRDAVASWQKVREQVFRGLGGGVGVGVGGMGGRPNLPPRGPMSPPAPGQSGMSASRKDMMTRMGPMGPGRMGMGAQEKASPLTDRYVDANGEPLADPAKPPFEEFKMMPICLRLLISEKKIPQLLAECANSNMPISVRAVRLAPDAGEAITLAGTGPLAGIMGPGAGPARREAPPTRSRSMPGEERQASGEPRGYLPIEVDGIIYIYNPPDMKKLGTGTTGVGQSETAPAGGPAAVPAAAAPPAAPPSPPPVLPATKGGVQ